jgi:hypothetical protein
MKNLVVIAAALAVSLPATAAYANGAKPQRPATTGERMATKAATMAGRGAAGAAIGGAAGTIIRGGALGTGVGIILSPTRTGCAALRGC